MNDARLMDLAERRAALVELAADQRNQLALAADPLRTVCSAADQGIMIASYLRQRPLLLAGGIAAGVLLRPAFVWKWLKRGLLAWRISHVIKSTLSNL